jgi:hypothetical protein
MQFSHASTFVTPHNNFEIAHINTTAHRIAISYTEDTRDPRYTGVFANQPHRIQ